MTRIAFHPDPSNDDNELSDNDRALAYAEYRIDHDGAPAPLDPVAFDTTNGVLPKLKAQFISSNSSSSSSSSPGVTPQLNGSSNASVRDTSPMPVLENAGQFGSKFTPDFPELPSSPVVSDRSVSAPSAISSNSQSSSQHSQSLPNALPPQSTSSGSSSGADPLMPHSALLAANLSATSSSSSSSSGPRGTKRRFRPNVSLSSVRFLSFMLMNDKAIVHKFCYANNFNR